MLSSFIFSSITHIHINTKQMITVNWYHILFLFLKPSVNNEDSKYIPNINHNVSQNNKTQLKGTQVSL